MSARDPGSENASADVISLRSGFGGDSIARFVVGDDRSRSALFPEQISRTFIG